MRLTILELPARWNAADRALAEVDTALTANRQTDVVDAALTANRETDVVDAALTANRDADVVDAALTANRETDVVLLPEASLHGYVSPYGDFDLAPFAEPLDGATSRACGALAAKHCVHLIAPLVLREGSALYNAMVAYAPDGTLAFVYRKRHPWLPETWATPGAQPLPVVTLCERQVTIAICYDLHFLPREAAAQLSRADLLLFPSAWVEEPDLRLPRLTRLAQHFGLTIANANWAPGDVRVPGQGGSCVVAPDGSVVATARDGRLDATIPPR